MSYLLEASNIITHFIELLGAYQLAWNWVALSMLVPCSTCVVWANENGMESSKTTYLISFFFAPFLVI